MSEKRREKYGWKLPVNKKYKLALGCYIVLVELLFIKDPLSMLGTTK